MPTQVKPEQFNDLIDVVASFPHGAHIEQILQKFIPTLPRRTMQRRLAALVADGRLSMAGAGRTVAYRTCSTWLEKNVTYHAREEEKYKEIEFDGIWIPFSPEVYEKLTQSMKVREPHPVYPAGYRRSFLDAYQPNETFYLNENIRRHLHSKGYSPHERPAGTYARTIYDRLLIDLSWNSSRLERNTYSLLETQLLLEQGQSAQNKAPEETRMILNHKDAIRFLIDNAELIGFNRYSIFNLHYLLSRELLGNPGASGYLRKIEVEIKGSIYKPPAIPQLIEECFQLILDKAAAITDPFEQAFFAMVHLPYLQPFEDVNKRTSRLAANIPLIKGNFCPFSFINVPEKAYVQAILAVYERNDISSLRELFIWAYVQSCGQYAQVVQGTAAADRFDWKYRSELRQTTAEVALACMDKVKADEYVKLRAASLVPEEHRARFIEVVETNLRFFHYGAMAYYGLRPPQWEAWQVVWNAMPAEYVNHP